MPFLLIFGSRTEYLTVKVRVVVWGWHVVFRKMSAPMGGEGRTDSCPETERRTTVQEGMSAGVLHSSRARLSLGF